MADRPGEIRPDTRFDDCPEQQLSCWVPSPINERLNALVDLLCDQWEQTKKKEIVGALVLQAPDTVEALSKLVTALRRGKAVDAAIKAPGRTDQKILTLRRGRRGPRPRKTAG